MPFRRIVVGAGKRVRRAKVFARAARIKMKGGRGALMGGNGARIRETEKAIAALQQLGGVLGKLAVLFNKSAAEQANYEISLDKTAQTLNRTGKAYDSNIKFLEKMRNELSLTREEGAKFFESIHEAEASGLGKENFVELTKRLKDLRGKSGINTANRLAQGGLTEYDYRALANGRGGDFASLLRGAPKELRRDLMEGRRALENTGQRNRAVTYEQAVDKVNHMYDEMIKRPMGEGGLLPFGIGNQFVGGAGGMGSPSKFFMDLGVNVNDASVAFDTIIDRMDAFDQALQRFAAQADKLTEVVKGRVSELKMGLQAGGLGNQGFRNLIGEQTQGARKKFDYLSQPVLEERMKTRAAFMQAKIGETNAKTPQEKERFKTLAQIEESRLQELDETLYKQIEEFLQKAGSENLMQKFEQFDKAVLAPLEEELEFNKTRLEIYGTIGNDLAGLNKLQSDTIKKQDTLTQRYTEEFNTLEKNRREAIEAVIQKHLGKDEETRIIAEINRSFGTSMRATANKLNQLIVDNLEQISKSADLIVEGYSRQLPYRTRKAGIATAEAQITSAEAQGITPTQAQDLYGRRAALARQQAEDLQKTQSQALVDIAESFAEELKRVSGDAQATAEIRARIAEKQSQRIIATEEAVANARRATAEASVKGLEAEKQHVQVGTSILEQQKSVAEYLGSSFGVIYQKQTEIVRQKSREVELTRQQLHEMKKDFGEFHPEVQRLTRELAQQQAELFKESIGMQRDWFDKALGRMFGAEGIGSKFQPGITERALFGERSLFQGMMSRGVVTPAQQRAGIRQGILQGMQQPGNAGMGFGVGNPAAGRGGFNGGPVAANSRNPNEKIPLDIEIKVKAAPGLMAEATIKGKRGHGTV